jgi:hypothetical protein
VGDSKAVSGAIGWVGNWLKRYLVVWAFLGIAGLWLYSHLFPRSFGSCREVPLNVGTKASVRDCQAYGSTDFLVPLALVVLAVLLLSSADIEFTIPGFGTVKRKREGEQAAEVLKQETHSLDQRGEKFLDTLPPPAGPPQ